MGRGRARIERHAANHDPKGSDPLTRVAEWEDTGTGAAGDFVVGPVDSTENVGPLSGVNSTDSAAVDETAGRVLTADGAGGSSWQPIPAPAPAVGVLMAMSTPGLLSVLTGSMRWYADTAGTLLRVDLGLGATPSGAAVAVTVKKNGTAIGSQTIAPGAVQAVITPSSGPFAAGNWFTYDITAIGTSTPGSDLAVQFIGTLG